jgi:hypothetical protein
MATAMASKARGRGFAVLGRPLVFVAMIAALTAGCETPSPHTASRNYGLRPDVPVDPPHEPGAGDSAEGCANGGRLFKLYCGSCHNARPLSERPFSNYQTAVTHMRDQAYLTGEEYRQIIMFLRRWDDVGPPTPPTEPSPKRFFFSQPIAEARGEAAPPGGLPPVPAGGGAFGPPGERPADPAANQPAP